MSRFVGKFGSPSRRVIVAAGVRANERHPRKKTGAERVELGVRQEAPDLFDRVIEPSQRRYDAAALERM